MISLVTMKLPINMKSSVTLKFVNMKSSVNMKIHAKRIICHCRWNPISYHNTNNLSQIIFKKGLWNQIIDLMSNQGVHKNRGVCENVTPALSQMVLKWLCKFYVEAKLLLPDLKLTIKIIMVFLYSSVSEFHRKYCIL